MGLSIVAEFYRGLAADAGNVPDWQSTDDLRVEARTSAGPEMSTGARRIGTPSSVTGLGPDASTGSVQC